MARRRTCSLRRPRSGGFTFTEVLFAVILLGIGFIMLAGMFPVAIQQTRTTAEETAATTSAQRAVRQISAVATRDNFSPSANARRIEDSVWLALAGGMVDEKNPQYGWVPLYRRESGDRYAQLIIISLQARHEGGVFDPAVHFARQGGTAAVEPRGIEFRVTPQTSGLHHVAIIAGSNRGAVGEGAHVVHRRTGKYFRLGARVGSPGQFTWEMAPGHNLSHADVDNWNSTDPEGGLVVGRPYANPADPSWGFEGNPMDIGLYSTFILLK
jgi:type II secretory pathway pseudopilin PulG